jgi:hypothetical protein
MTRHPLPPTTGRRGIALVIVLSLMAALMILAVGFAISMRTEHKAAKMSGSQMQAVEMCYYGLAQALDHIERDARYGTMWTGTVHYPQSAPITGGWVYPGWSNHCLHSGMRPVTNDTAAWFPDNRAVRFIPQALMGPSGTAHNVNVETNRLVCRQGGNVHTVKFVDVYATNVQRRMVGRYAYMVVDGSGLIDANGSHELDPDVGRALPRMLGTNACELAFNSLLLKEMRTGKETNLHNARVGTDSIRHQRFGRVESLEDLRTVGYGGYPVQGNSPLRAFSDPDWLSRYNNTNYPNNFITYTRYPDGLGAIPLLMSTNLASDAHHVANNTDIVFARLTNAMLNPIVSEVRTLVTNIIDYLDTDFIPGGINGGPTPDGPNADNFCTEPVPMLHRLDIMSNYVTPTNLFITLYVETLFPFLYTSSIISNPPPQLQLNFKYRLTGGDFTPSDVSISSNIDASAFAWITGTPSSPGGAQYSAPFGLGVTNHHRSIFGSPPVRLEVTEFSITVRGQNTVVDRVRPPVLSEPASAVLAPTPLISTNCVVRWFANDQRMNWIMTGAGAQWTNLSIRFGNAATPRATMQLSAREKGEWFSYVSNQNKLFALGELGYLLHRSDRPWRTLAFFTDTPDDANDFINPWAQFRLVHPTRYGLINPSTRITNVLATAFNRCPFQLAPGITASGVANLPVAGAYSIASEIINRRPGQGYTNLNFLAGLQSLTLANALALGNTSHMGREGILRCTEGLLGTRNNTFMVFVLGQGATQLDDPEGGRPVRRTAGQRAIALVWRDPFSSPTSPKHFVRWMRWQDDWVGDVSDQF